MTYSDDMIRRTLREARTIAVVGLSANPDRPSHRVARDLARRGHRVIGVNPGLAGQEMFGTKVAPDLAGIREPVDMVDIFRASDAVLPVVEAALAQLSGLKTIWMQLGVIHPGAAALAEAQGVAVIMDRCPSIEYRRLFDAA